MPFALATIGLLLIIAGARGTYGDLKKLLVSDFTGENNFFYWIASIGAVGTIGYIPDFEKFSRTFIALIIIAMIIRQDGFFDKLKAAIANIDAGDSSATESGGNVPAAIEKGAGSFSDFLWKGNPEIGGLVQSFRDGGGVSKFLFGK